MKLRTGRLSLLAAMLSCSALQAETFLLNDGGRIDGQWLNVDEKPQTKYVVRSSGGATLTLAKESVKQVVKKSPAELEYEIVRHQHPDTVAGHLALAQWCQEQKLTEIRKQHLERVLELDPNQRDARSVLGFAKIGGQWRTREQHLSSMGKIQHNGEWLYPQEIEILDRRAEQTRSRLEWTANLKRWRSWLGGDKESTARTNIAAISEPAAYAALQQMLNEEKVDAVRVMYVRALGRIGTYEALISIADRSLLDPSPDVRAISLDLLVEKPQAAIVNYFIQQLQSKDNVAVNRSAFAFFDIGSQVGDCARYNGLRKDLGFGLQRQNDLTPNAVRESFGVTGGQDEAKRFRRGRVAWRERQVLDCFGHPDGAFRPALRGAIDDCVFHFLFLGGGWGGRR